jgi:hypothetical protein
MKKIISLVTIISSIFSACNSTSNSNESHSHHVDSLDVISATSQVDSTQQKHINTDGKFDEVVSSYINLKILWLMTIVMQPAMQGKPYCIHSQN